MATVEARETSLQETRSDFTIRLRHDQLNQTDCEEVLEEMARLLEEDSFLPDAFEVKLDLQRIERINSTGLNKLIGMSRKARNSGVRLVLLNVQDSVRDIFVLTRLERMFELRGASLGS